MLMRFVNKSPEFKSHRSHFFKIEYYIIQRIYGDIMKVDENIFKYIHDIMLKENIINVLENIFINLHYITIYAL